MPLSGRTSLEGNLEVVLDSVVDQAVVTRSDPSPFHSSHWEVDQV